MKSKSPFRQSLRMVRLGYRRVLIFIIPVVLQKIKFYKRLNYWPSLKNPLTLNEAIFKLKVNSSEKDYRYVDKLLAFEYVSDIAQNKKLTKLCTPEVLSQSESPQSFIKNLPSEKCFLKANHGSGMCIYYDPATSLTDDQRNEVGSWLKVDYALRSGERCYSKVQRKLFSEKVLVCSEGSLPDDIKVHCFSGKPSVIQVIRRSSGKLERQTFDENWKERAWFKNEVLKTNLDNVPKGEVLEYSELLAQPFEFVRVDFYLVDNILYFSELTLYPASASLPLKSKEVDLLLGEKYRAHKV